MAHHSRMPIRVNNPHRLKFWQIPAERIAIGKGYKPSIALLPDGTLILVAGYANRGIPQGGIPADPEDPDAMPWWTWDETLPCDKWREWHGVWYSSDGGLTWSERRGMEDLAGREMVLTCTSDGTLFGSAALIVTDINNDRGYMTSWLLRSTDGGATWDRTEATIDRDLRGELPDQQEYTYVDHNSRNVVELPDGTLLYGVSVNNSTVAYMWRSADKGKTWDKTRRAKLESYDNFDGFFGEAYTYLNDAGKLLHWCRVGHPSPMAPMNDGRPFPTENDNCDRMMHTYSTDEGKTWPPLVDFGDYGQMYPRITRLKDGRLLMTYTQRGLTYPFGLRATISYDDGEIWDMATDQIVIEGFTTWGAFSGGGFGNTVELDDGTLVSCYSYNPGNMKFDLEVVRWHLP